MSLVHLLCLIGFSSGVYADIRFENLTNYPTGGISTGVFAEDFDGDGDIDFAISNRESDSITVLFNNGAGVFGNSTQFQTGINPRYVDGFDFDNDGDIDLCTPDYYGMTTTLLNNDGSGGFSIAQQFDTFTPAYVWNDDLDLDGHRDIIVLHWDGTAKVPHQSPGVVQPFYGNGDGTFVVGQSAFIGVQPRGGASADLNGDGLLDVVVADIYSKTISVLLSTGPRTWQTSFQILMDPGAPRYITLEDYDNDGDVDIAAVDKLHGNFWILANDGNAKFVLNDSVKVNDAPHSIVHFDIDNDGDLDFVVTHVGSSSHLILHNDGSGRIESEQMFTISGGSAEVKLADFNADGLIDIVTANVNNALIGSSVLLQKECWVCNGARSGKRVVECPPIANEINMQAISYLDFDVQLTGESIAGNSVDYIISSLPSSGDLIDVYGNTITTVPYHIPNDTVTYSPVYGYIGLDTFTYYVNDCLPSTEALVALQINIPFPDECLTAQRIFNGSTVWSTLFASDSPDYYDPLLCSGTNFGAMRKDIWFRYFACETGQLVIDTCGTTVFDSDIVVYQGSCCNLEQIACNGDSVDCNGNSRITIDPIIADTQYFIRIGGSTANSFGGGTIFIAGPEVICAASCFGDLNFDGNVNITDFLQIIGLWGSTCGDGDLNIDGVVNVVDLLAVIGAWGPCGG